MHAVDLTKTDGRSLTLYGRTPFETPAEAPSPSPEPVVANPHLRWHPLRDEWITYAAHRQGRTFMPPPRYNPLAPTTDPSAPTELPAGDWDVAVFDNRFPSLSTTAHSPPLLPVPTAAKVSICLKRSIE